MRRRNARRVTIGRGIAVIAALTAVATVAFLWFAEPRPEPAPAYVDCLAACRASMQRAASTEEVTETRRIVFDTTDPENPVPRSDGLAITLSLEGARVVGQAGSSNVLSLRIDSPDHLIRFDFAPPVDAREIDLISVGVRTTPATKTAAFGFVKPGAEMVPVAFDVHRGQGLIPVEDLPLWTGPIAAIAFRIEIDLDRLPGRPVLLQIGEVKFWHSPDPLARIEFERRWSGAGGARADSARLSASDAPSWRVKIANETRPAVYAPAPSRCECRLRVPRRAAIDAEFGMLVPSWNEPSGGATFSVSVRTRDGTQTEILSQSVDPYGDPAHRRWFERRLSLRDYEDRAVTLVFETCAAKDCRAKDDARNRYAVWSNLDVVQPRREGRSRPSVLLVSLDTLRADRLGCYGYPRGTSPNIDAFAAEGILFENAVAQAPETLASHMSLFTGLYPREHGMQRTNRRLSNDIPLLVEEFRRAGYRTGAFTEDARVSSSLGFDRPFQSYHDGAANGARGPKHVEDTFGLAARWLERFADRPFFLFVHTYEVHVPYDPPAADVARFAPRYEGSVETPFVVNEIGPNNARLKKNRVSDADFEYVSSLYDAGIHHADAELGRLLTTLVELDIEDSTLRVILADHGEEFWDHFAFAIHGYTLYDELIHVPLIFAGDGLDGRRGMRIRDQVQLVDVLPTILDLAAIPYDAGASSGRSFRPLLEERALPARDALSEGTKYIERTSIRADVGGARYKLIHSPGIAEHPLTPFFLQLLDLSRFSDILQEWELYSLDEDPGERRNLARERPEVLAELKKRLSSYRAEHVPRAEPEPGEIDADVRERMRALGYDDE